MVIPPRDCESVPPPGIRTRRHAASSEDRRVPSIRPMSIPGPDAMLR